MGTKFENQMNEYFNKLSVWWVGFIISIYMLSLPELNEGSFKYIVVAMSLFSPIMLLVSLGNVINFTGKYFEKEDELLVSVSNEFELNKETTSRTVFNYLNRFHVEHPYIALSLTGLIIAEYYTGFSEIIQRDVKNIPIVSNVFPSLYLVIILMVFADYTYHIKSKYIRRGIKIVIIVYLPVIIGYIFAGLITPFTLMAAGLFNISSVKDIQYFLSDSMNIFWLIVYPLVAFHIFKCSFIGSTNTLDNVGLERTTK